MSNITSFGGGGDENVFEINQPGHGFSLLGTNSEVPLPVFVDSTGKLSKADATSVQKECLGLATIIDNNTLEYNTTKGKIFELDNPHGYSLGSILYLTNTGDVDVFPGTNFQKIYEVISDTALMFTGYPMMSSAGASLATTIFKLQNITGVNTIAPGTDIQIDTNPEVDTIGVSNITSTGFDLPAGFYEFRIKVGFQSFGARTNVFNHFYVNNVLTETNFGGNYARNATGHNQPGDSYEYYYTLTNPSTISFKFSREAGASNVNIIGNLSGIPVSKLIIKKLG